ncbi:MAG TPA: hypothetical protein VN706_14635 [Gemmatimonadaceae bacterium]|nr:hypothetical protein [Gemmatimonadaceae bacterium]
MSNESGKQGQNDQDSTAGWAADGVLAAARACLRRAIENELSPDTTPRDLRASDAVFRQLSDCVQEYVRVLARLKHDERSILETILGVFDDAAFPDEPHPALRMAVAEWAAEALEESNPSTTP